MRRWVVYDIIRERFKDTKGRRDFLYKFLLEAKNLEKNKMKVLIVRIYKKMTATQGRFPTVNGKYLFFGGFINIIRPLS
ncbi:hypothetical protein DF182_13250 [Chitinophaga flava]|uniref:Uncharacterized protein n=1 Tax=Chitinophaga flava TaxID=2259036 RepID=A0A365Y4G0_9BACT|nr:hypothetical protein DF182_13250 [Chitinophaga flava]